MPATLRDTLIDLEVGAAAEAAIVGREIAVGDAIRVREATRMGLVEMERSAADVAIVRLRIGTLRAGVLPLLGVADHVEEARRAAFTLKVSAADPDVPGARPARDVAETGVVRVAVRIGPRAA